jgi:hypothetical protein
MVTKMTLILTSHTLTFYYKYFTSCYFKEDKTFSINKTTKCNQTTKNQGKKMKTLPFASFKSRENAETQGKRTWGKVYIF